MEDQTFFWLVVGLYTFFILFTWVNRYLYGRFFKKLEYFQRYCSICSFSWSKNPKISYKGSLCLLCELKIEERIILIQRISDGEGIILHWNDFQPRIDYL